MNEPIEAPGHYEGDGCEFPTADHFVLIVSEEEYDFIASVLKEEKE